DGDYPPPFDRCIPADRDLNANRPTSITKFSNRRIGAYGSVEPPAPDIRGIRFWVGHSPEGSNCVRFRRDSGPWKSSRAELHPECADDQGGILGTSEGDGQGRRRRRDSLLHATRA